MFANNGESFDAPVVTSTRTSLVVDMTLLRPSHFGDLNCTVSVARRGGGTFVSSMKKIANVYIDKPIVDTPSDSILSDQIEYVLYVMFEVRNALTHSHFSFMSFLFSSKRAHKHTKTHTRYGHNFDRVPSGNRVHFESHCVSAESSECTNGCDPSSDAYPETVQATVKNVTIGSDEDYDEMKIHFDTLAPYFGGCQLKVTVETGNVST